MLSEKQQEVLPEYAALAYVVSEPWVQYAGDIPISSTELDTMRLATDLANALLALKEAREVLQEIEYIEDDEDRAIGLKKAIDICSRKRG